MRACESCGTCSDDQYELCAADGGGLKLVFPGSRILAGRYRLERKLAQGAMGQVYEAEHLAVGSRVAVKVMQPSQRDVGVAFQRFHKEARILGAVKHPNAVLITDFDVDRRGDVEIAFLVTELLRGRSLAALLDEQRQLHIDEVARIISPLCDALEEAHAQGIIHRDLKPSNVFLERLRDGSEIVKVLDFGIAKLLAKKGAGPAPVELPSLGTDADLRAEILSALDEEAVDTPTVTGRHARSDHPPSSGPASTYAGLMVGTVPYMAAEQMTGDRVTRRSDVHALAVIIFEMLAGQLPFDGDDDDVINQKLADERPSLRDLGVDVDADLDAVLRQAFAVDAEARPERVGVLAEAVANASRRRRGAVVDPIGEFSLRLSTTARALQRLEGDAASPEVVRDTLLSAGAALSRSRDLLPLVKKAMSAPPQTVLVAAFVELDDGVATARGAVASLNLQDPDAQAHLLLMWRQLDAFSTAVGDVLDDAVDEDGESVGDDAVDIFADVAAVVAEDVVPFDTLVDAVVGKDGLAAADAVDSIIGDRVDDAVLALQAGGPLAERLIDGLWRYADTLLLRDLGVEKGALRFLPMLAHHPLDRGRFHGVMSALRDRRGTAILDELKGHEGNEPILRCLLLHPVDEVRKGAAGQLPLASIWTVVAHPRTPLVSIVSLFFELKKRGHGDHLKVFFFCVKDAMAKASTGELRDAVILVRAFFDISSFHEDLIFEPLLELERHLRTRAGAAGLLDESYARALAVFVGAGVNDEVPLERLRDVPLALQRKLAREGRFLSTFIAHNNERIAWETVPHLLRLDDITRFLRIITMHRVVLVELAKRRRFFKGDAAKLALLGHPKTPAAIARGYIGLVSDENLRQLSTNRHINPEVRRLIQADLRQERQ
jgi:serine/threonine protein kinase